VAFDGTTCDLPGTPPAPDDAQLTGDVAPPDDAVPPVDVVTVAPKVSSHGEAAVEPPELTGSLLPTTGSPCVVGPDLAVPRSGTVVPLDRPRTLPGPGP
jgi:hypothetical protein